jgi:hypothetical protein
MANLADITIAVVVGAIAGFFPAKRATMLSAFGYYERIIGFVLEHFNLMIEKMKRIMMKKATKDVKKITIILMMITLLGLVTSCKPTPDELVVIPKENTELLVYDSAKNNDNSNIDFVYEVPEHVTKRYPIVEDRLDMVIDADVYVLDLYSVPVAKIVSDSFTQERADEILEFFMEDGYLVTPWVRTKAEYDEWILEAKADGAYLLDEYGEE